MRLLLGLPSPCLPGQGEGCSQSPTIPLAVAFVRGFKILSRSRLARESFVICKASGALPFCRQAFRFMLAVRCDMTVFRAACK